MISKPTPFHIEIPKTHNWRDRHSWIALRICSKEQYNLSLYIKYIIVIRTGFYLSRYTKKHYSSIQSHQIHMAKSLWRTNRNMEYKQRNIWRNSRCNNCKRTTDSYRNTPKYVSIASCFHLYIVWNCRIELLQKGEVRRSKKLTQTNPCNIQYSTDQRSSLKWNHNFAQNPQKGLSISQNICENRSSRPRTFSICANHTFLSGYEFYSSHVVKTGLDAYDNNLAEKQLLNAF